MWIKMGQVHLVDNKLRCQRSNLPPLQMGWLDLNFSLEESSTELNTRAKWNQAESQVHQNNRLTGQVVNLPFIWERLATVWASVDLSLAPTSIPSLQLATVESLLTSCQDLDSQRHQIIWRASVLSGTKEDWMLEVQNLLIIFQHKEA